MREIFAGMPWWVKWVAVPLIALVVFGGLIASFIGILIWLLFKVLLFVALVGGLIFVVGSSRRRPRPQRLVAVRTGRRAGERRNSPVPGGGIAAGPRRPVAAD